jgi:hypothetical protein
MSRTGRAIITQIGGFTNQGFPIHWSFDCRGMSEVTMFSLDFRYLCGYSLEELREIAEGEKHVVGEVVVRLSEAWRSLPEKDDYPEIEVDERTEGMQ